MQRKEVPAEDLLKLPKENFYVPVHQVFKEASTTTKIHPVFDTSAKTSTDSSLNDILLPTPSLLPMISALLTTFRSFPIALTAGVGKMFWEVALRIIITATSLVRRTTESKISG